MFVQNGEEQFHKKTTEYSVDFYDFKNFVPINGGKEYVVNFNDLVNVTYSDLKFWGDKEKYECHEIILREFIKELLNIFLSNTVILKKYNANWIINKKISHELYELFKRNDISNNYSGCIAADRNSKFVDLMVQAIFRYNCFAAIVTNDSVIFPTDHMDIFVTLTKSTSIDSLLTLVDDYKKKGIDLNVRERE